METDGMPLRARKEQDPVDAVADDDKVLWRPETVASKLDVSVRTLERWRATGLFPDSDMRMGAKLMWWRRETVLNWIKAQQTG